MDNYSLGIRISDLTDFHSQSCVKPLIIEKNSGKKAEIKVKQDGTYLEISEDGKESILESAKISLNDCLACR
jgi:iron only hydrogenase large subunit-like protein